MCVVSYNRWNLALGPPRYHGSIRCQQSMFLCNIVTQLCNKQSMFVRNTFTKLCTKQSQCKFNLLPPTTHAQTNKKLSFSNQEFKFYQHHAYKTFVDFFSHLIYTTPHEFFVVVQRASSHVETNNTTILFIFLLVHRNILLPFVEEP